MDDAHYTPGHSETAVALMASRDAASHAGFFLPHLRTGMRLLDCGCGPGLITVDLAEAVAPASVTGIDAADDQFAIGRAEARLRGLPVTFVQASAYALPFDDGAFDAVFSHALLEHLADPVAALTEFARVLAPGGVLGVASPDWGGFILAPPGEAVDGAIHAYTALQRRNGGDPLAGRWLGAWLLDAGLADVRVDARYERYEDPSRIADYLAEQLHAAREPGHASALRTWAKQPGATFAQTWVSAVARRT
jgi:SAM-dependent methyltransferase